MSAIVERNHVTVAGSGPPVVFAHGFGCDQTVWRRVAPAFVADHTVVLFDHVGAGRSDRSAYDPARYATLDGYARDLLEVCDVLGLDQPAFVGHSVGTMIGAVAAASAPGRFSRLVLLAPSPRFLDDPPDYVGGFQRDDIEQLLSLMDANFTGWATSLSQMAAGVDHLAQELRQSFCASDPRILREFARIAFLGDHRAVLPRVTTPSLVVQCTRDDLAPVCVGEYVARRLQRGTLALLDAPGHLPHLSHPEEVLALARGWLGGEA